MADSVSSLGSDGERARAGVQGSLAVTNASGDAPPDVSVLERNSYIIIGLLGGTIVLLAVLGTLVVRAQRQERAKGYAPVGREVAERCGRYD